jgi:hypothetical protein
MASSLLWQALRLITASRSMLFVVLLFWCGPVAQAQEPAVSLKSKSVAINAQNCSFAELTSLLSKQIGCSILVDDQPLRQNADIEFTCSAEQALDQVADAFDYRWSVVPSGVIVMSKGFKDIHEYPQITLPEQREMTQNIVTILRASGYKETDTLASLGHAFMQALTLEQGAILRKGDHISVVNLTPQQQSLAQMCLVAHAFAAPYTAWNRLSTQLDSLETSTLAIRKAIQVVQRPDKPGELFLDSSVPTEARYACCLLSQDRQGHLLEESRLAYLPDNAREATPPTRNLPMDLTGQQRSYDDPKLATVVDLPLGKTTVAELMATLSRRSGLAIEATDALKPHKLIVQASHLRVFTLLNALAQLTGWTWSRLDPSHFLITSPAPAAVQQPGEIAYAIRAALAKDLRVYFNVPLEETKQTMPPIKDFGLYKGQAEIRKLFDELNLNSLEAKPIPFRRLTPQQQIRLLRGLAFTAIDSTAGLFANRLTALRLSQADATNTSIGMLSQFQGGDPPILLCIEPPNNGLYAFSLGSMSDLNSQ